MNKDTSKAAANFTIPRRRGHDLRQVWIARDSPLFNTKNLQTLGKLLI